MIQNKKPTTGFIYITSTTRYFNTTIIMKKLTYLLFYFLLSFIACQPSPSGLNEEIIKIDFSRSEKENLPYQASYIKLIEKEESSLISRIEKITVKNDQFYLMDGYLKKIIVADKRGHITRSYEKTGDGPGEITNLTDFIVDEEGHLFLYDGTADKLVEIDAEGQTIHTRKLPFKIENIHCLKNGNYLIALAPYNEGNYKGEQVIVTDRDFRHVHKELTYSSDVDPNFHFNSSFIETEKYIVYNRVIDNHVYLFSPDDGHLVSHLRFDFGGQTIPDSRMKDINKLLNQSAFYSFLATTPIVQDRYLLFMTNKEGTLYTCAYHKNTGATSFSRADKMARDVINFPLYYAPQEKCIVTYLHSDMIQHASLTTLPRDVADYIEEGNTVLCLYKLEE